MKKYKKIITGLILALICGIMPFVSVAKVKALTVDEITTINDLKNTKWSFNNNFADYTVTSTVSYIIYSSDSSLNIASFYYGENLENEYKLFSNGESYPFISLRTIKTPSMAYCNITLRNSTTNTIQVNESSTNTIKSIYNVNELRFNSWNNGEVLVNDESLFLERLKALATFQGVIEAENYNITFNLNGGTSEQPEDIEFNTSITINKNDLPIPTRENYKFLHWAWADTDNIEYAEPFTQESLTFTDTNIYMWAIWTLYDVNMVFHLNNILILDARLVFTELEQPEEIAGEIIDKIAKIELIGDNVTTFKMIISTLSENPMLESSSPYISYILNYTNHVEIGFNFNSEYLNSISATSLYNVAEWTNIEQDTSFNDYLEIYINKPGQVIEVELESAKLVNDDIDNINTGANAVFSIITNFLNINIGFLTVGSIIAVLLAVAVLGFIIKIWQGGNNG